jgi:uncharacterized protein (TIGR03435 family)
MVRRMVVAALAFSVCEVFSQAVSAPVSRTVGSARPVFDVATIKPVETDAKAGRYIVMQGTHRFIGKNYTLKLLIAAAYNLNSRAISGGPPWMESAHYDIEAVTPGDVRPSREEQMLMLQGLLGDRFKLTFHREPKEFSIYELQIAKNGPRLKESTAPASDPAALISTVYPQRMVLPARNATMGEFVSMLQRALLDRPVVDKTGLSGKYDFDLEWAPDETQFGGEVPAASADAPSAPFFSAIQQQLGLRLEATRGPIEALVVDKVERPSEN